MTTVRSRSPRSKQEERSSEESRTDWSIFTPSDTVTASTSTEASVTRHTVATASTHGRRTRAATAASTATVDATTTEAPNATTTTTTTTTTNRITRSAPTTTTTARTSSTHPAASMPAPTSIPHNEPRTHLKNIGRPNVPPFASSETMVPRTTRSSRSRKAELKAQVEFQKKQLVAAETAAALARTELELMQCDSEDEIFDEYETERRSHVEQWVQHTASYVEPSEKREEPSSKSELKELADAIIVAARTTQPTPTPQKVWDLPDFNGSNEEWLPFKRSYMDSAEQFNDVQNMARLRRTIKGAAKEAVRSLLFASSEPQEILAALERRFGRPEQLVLAEVEKLKDLPRISDAPRDICTFASQVSNAVTTIEALKKAQYLYSPEITRIIIEKLSPILRYRWFDFNASVNHDEPELVKLKKFLNSEADLCGSFAPPDLMKKRFGQRKFPIHTTREEEETRIVATTSEAYKKNCYHCNGEHWLTECKSFKEATTDEKWEIAKQKRLCFKCLRLRHIRTNCKAQPCRRCKKPHHTMLHSELMHNKAPSTQQQKLAPSPCNQTKETEDIRPVYNAADGAKIYLKMMPVDIFGPKGSARVLALLDEGSTVSLLDASIASRIGATGEEKELTLETVGGKIITKERSQKIDLKIRGIHRKDKRSLRGVRTIEELKLSPQHVDKKSIEQCKHLMKLKNELIYEKERPALLIGQDNWDLIVSRKILKGKRSEPVASLTSLGWVLHGGHTGTKIINFVNHCRTNNNEETLEELIKRHFELDSIGIRERRPSNDADEQAMRILKDTTRRLSDGRYESGLLWKSESEKLPNNYTQARNRLLGVERKIDRDAALKKEYNKQISNLLTSGYAEEAPENSTTNRTFYLPHFAVKHPLKGKIRIVFDAAAKHEGKSLNDALLSGPDLLQSLFGVLVRFREGPVAVVADVKEMFLQIQIRKEDRDSLRFLWRGDDRKSKPKEYRMKSVIFGAASSPATAIYVKNMNAEKYAEEHPEAARAIIQNHYMDDYLQSFPTTKEAASIANEVDQVHKKAGFILKQWASNKEEALANINISEDIKEKRLGQEEEKTLGMRWLVKTDKLAFNVDLRNTPLEVKNGNKKPTKREVTSAVMSTFDPLGLAAPVLIMGKKMIQDLWRSGIQWDEEINEEQHHAWKRYTENIKALSHLKIPRCLAPTERSGEIHTFVDASETAYAAAVYWRSTANGEVNVRLVAGKARVAPVKATSIPRLELQAALLGARLAASVCKETDLEITNRVFWSDSTTVLQWLKADPRRFKVFITHRLAAIEEISKPNEWRWVPTRDNPADDATRDAPRDFDEESRWFRGPAFLYSSESDWPVKEIRKQEDDSELKKKNTCTIALINEKTKLLDPRKFSNWWRLLRTTARVHMFIDMCQRKASKESSERKINKTHLPIETKHLKRAEETLIRNSQEESFAREMNNIKRNKPIERSSRLKNVDIALSENGILRLRSRTSKIETSKQGLPILDGREHTTQLIIEHYHRRLFHSSHATVINELRQKYWIVSLREAVKKIAYKCQWCKMRRSKPQMPPPGDLPRERLAHHQPPFTCAAVDYFGPMHVTIGRRHEKRWGALFTCLTTRAIHLELATSLSTSSMIMALRRMAARRGSPRVIFSDNGTNFVGANNELKSEIKKIKNENLVQAAEQEGITWKFIPPGAPHMGGAWERMVRSVKVALVTVLGEKSPPEEVLYTLLTEIEHTVNSRPLTHLSADPRDEESLTPNHFLIGRSCGAAVLGEFDDSCLVGRADWKTVQQMANHFWSRWMREYLPTLMPRKTCSSKNMDFHEGDVVIIADSTLPRNTWPRGQIEKTYPGPDGRIRIVDVRTKGGTLRRPVSRLILMNKTPLPEE